MQIKLRRLKCESKIEEKTVGDWLIEGDDVNTLGEGERESMSTETESLDVESAMNEMWSCSEGVLDL